MTRLAEIKIERDRAEQRAHLYACALQLVLTSDAHASETIRLDGDRYTLTVYGSDRADGGTLIERFTHSGQGDSVQAFGFEGWAREAKSRVGLSEQSTAFAIAAEHLERAIARRRIPC
jgi:hypothetical protein